MDEIVELERCEKGEKEIKKGRRVQDGVLRIGQEGLAVSVGVRPKGEVPLLEQARGRLAGRDLDDGRVPRKGPGR